MKNTARGAKKTPGAAARQTPAVRRADVARLAGVSPSAVSVVLNNTPGPRIPEATRSRVLAAARKLGYRANAVARALASGRTHTIGVVIHHMHTPFSGYTAGLLGGFWNVVHPQGYRMIVDEGGPERPLAGLFREGAVDGLVVLAPPPRLRDEEVDALLERGFPIIFAGSRPTDVPGDYADLDNLEAGRRATRILIDAGHTEILHVSGPVDVNSSAVDRRDGYFAELDAAGIPKRRHLVRNGSYSPLTSAQAVGAALEEGLRFTGVFAASVGMAHSVIRVLESRGIEVPRGVSVTSIDTDPPETPQGHAVTTVRQPLATIGAAAGEMLLERLGGRRGAARQRLIPGELVEGDTVAARGK